MLVDSLDLSNAPSATDTQTVLPRTNLEIDALGLGAMPDGATFARYVWYRPVSVKGSTAWIKPHNNKLDFNTSYYVTVDAGVLVGTIKGAAFAGISKADGWKFTTRPAPASFTSVRLVSGALVLACGWQGTLTQMGAFFTKAALLTFGGAYAVLAYVAQQAVDHYHWVTPGEMLDGLGMAETTPGPLIMVTQFVGFLAAWRAPGGMPPLLAATLGGLLTTWVTFVPWTPGPATTRATSPAG